MPDINLSVLDLIVASVLLVLIFVLEWGKYIRKRRQFPYYRYYLPGLYLKFLGGIGVCVTYIYYYRGGDTTEYFYDCCSMVNMFLKNPWVAIQVTFDGLNFERWLEFDDNIGTLIFSYDHNAFFVDRLIWILCLFSFKSFIGETILLAWISYSAVWRLYETMVEEFPTLQKEFAIAILFIPSVVFWGSGILKDTITFAAVCLFTSSFYGLMVKRRKIIKNMILMTIGAFLLLRIKPYILFALLPGSLLWVAGIVRSGISSKIARWLVTPLFLILSLSSGFLVLRSIGNLLGDYELSKVLNKAVVTQQDLKREEYGGSSFDIGDFDPSVIGVISKAPAAINATLFRPYVWEARNPVVVLSGLENLAMMLFTIYLIIKLRVYNLFRLMFRHHLLVFTVCFSLFFAFSVGLTTSNFGSLVRYKIPAIPFYVASLFIIRHTYVDLKRKDEEQHFISEEKRIARAYSSVKTELL